MDHQWELTQLRNELNDLRKNFDNLQDNFGKLIAVVRDLAELAKPRLNTNPGLNLGAPE